ncbi:MAG: tandem-95 repeat protein [Acidimicrobiia bacterium]|nr:tandem-95 repeat protein [Acidimicrobiia bacterium]
MSAEAVTADRARERWSSRPRAAFVVRSAAALTPIAVSVVFVAVVSRIVGRPSGLLPTVVWWVLLTGASTVVLLMVERGMRRFLPLAALFKMSLAFPDQAPSRYKAAMRTRTLRQLQRGLDEGQLPETAVGAQESAERLLALAMALNDHDRMTRGHTERVRAYTLMIGEEMGLPEADLDRLHWAGLVHDIGKLEVPPELLNKPGRPSDDEWQVIKQHPDAGFRLVEPLRPWLGEWADAASQHHERWDGKGYPLGLSGAEMSLSGRIVAVADAYDVMTSVRSYKTAMTPAEARAELARCAGTQFDPDVVRAFLNISIGRLRLVMGPLSWLAEFPLLGRVPVGAAGTAVSSLAAMTVAVIAGLTGHAPHSTHHEAAPVAQVQLATAAPPPSTHRPRPTTTTTEPPPSSTTTTTSSTTTTTSTTAPTAPGAEAPPPAPPADAVVNAAPTAQGTSVTTDEDTPVTVDLSPLVADPDGDALVAGVPGAPSFGHVGVDGLFLTYTPDANASGSDSFTYSVADPSGATASATVTVTVRPVDDAPVGGTIDVTTNEDTPITVDISSAVSDVDGDPLAIETVGTALHGSTGAAGTLEVDYSPSAQFHGADQFSVQVTDPDGAPATVTVAVTVVSVDDAPTASNRSATTNEDQAVTVDLTSAVGDADGDPLTVSALGAPGSGQVASSGLSVTYTPDANTNGTDTFTYTVADPDGATATGTVTVTVVPVNDAPVGGSASVTTSEDTPLTVDVSGSVSDVDGDALTITSVGSAPHGGTAANGALGVNYVPVADFHGSDQFTVQVSDPGGLSATVTVDVTVTPVNDAPTALDSTVLTTRTRRRPSTSRR